MKPVLIAMYFIITTAQAQDLSSHQWEDRILLIFTGDKNDEVFVKQISSLKDNLEELQERKVVIYQITPTQVKKGLGQKIDWQENRNLIKKKTTTSSFELQLIGLDGGIKLTDTSFVPAEKIFSKIDSMPMRRAEIRDNK